MSYARGKYAYGICDISGFRYKLKDMKKTWNGLLVGPDMYEPKHPQLEPRPPVVDPEALQDPRVTEPEPTAGGRRCVQAQSRASALEESQCSTGPTDWWRRWAATWATVVVVGGERRILLIGVGGFRRVQN